MDPIITKRFEYPIIFTKILDNGALVLVDDKTTVRHLRVADLEAISGFKTNIHHMRFKTDVIDFSSDGEYFVVMSANEKESLLLNASTKKVIAKVDRHHGEVSCVGMDRKNRYMFSCGDDGKIFAIDVKTGKLAFTLPNHADTVNDITFSKNGQWVATAGYDRKISVYNIAMMTPKDRLKGHSSAIMKLHFLDKNRLISIDKNSSAIVWDIYNSKVLARPEGIHDDVTALCMSEDGQFLFMGTALGYILVYDAKTYQQLSKKFIKLHATISYLTYEPNNDQLIVATNDGELLFYDIYAGLDVMKAHFEVKEYEAMQKCVEENPLLAYTKINQMVEVLWEKTLEKAKKFLQNNDKKSANALFNAFKHIPEKHSIIRKVLQDFQEFDKFVRFTKDGKMSLAYGLANQHPSYKESKVYEYLEAQWKKAYLQAEKLALDPKKADLARELLAPYRGVSVKTQAIQDLFNKGRVYTRFRDAVGKKDFRVVFELVKNNPYLKEFPEYTAVMNYADSLYIKAQRLIDDGDSSSALKLLRVLVQFKDFTDVANELMDAIANKQKFYDALNSGNMEKAYGYLDSTEALQNTPDGKRLMKQWNDDFDEAGSHASIGDVKGIQEALERYMHISSKQMSIATVMAWCYLSQLEDAMRKKQKRAEIENGIKTYLQLFGNPDQMQSFFEIFSTKYPETKLDLERLSKGSLKMFKPAMIVQNILA